ncbi:MAG TPA: glycosyltransferase [Candidatus Saccharimonadales bacterium]|nr:glycosyltransferase [Candidatus Saccharimonadales bacterium]
MLSDRVRCGPVLRWLEQDGPARGLVLEVRHDSGGLNGSWGGPLLGLGPVLPVRPGAGELALLADPVRLPLCDAAVGTAVWLWPGCELERGELEATVTGLLRVSAEWVVAGVPARRVELLEWLAAADGGYAVERLAWGSRLAEFAAELADRRPEVRPELERALRRDGQAWTRLACDTASPASGRALLVLRRRTPRQPTLAALEGLAGAGPAAVARALAPALRCPACGARGLEPGEGPAAPLRCPACGRMPAGGPRGIPDLRSAHWHPAAPGPVAGSCEAAPEVSVVIPAYGHPELTRQCLRSLFTVPSGSSFEVILVDNASPEDPSEALAEFLPRIRLQCNRVNVGFARGCNQGAREAAGRYLLFLNNDTEAHPGWLKPLVDLLDSNPDVGVVGSKLLFPDGRVQHAGVAVSSNPDFPQGVTGFHVYQHDPADAPHVSRPREFQVVTAACCLVRRELFEALGGFDPAYWNGFEDVDLCFRARAHGFRVMYQPRSVLTHHESMGGPERFARMDHNAKVLNARWAGRVRPDVHEIHLQDGFLIRWRRKASGPRTEVLPVGTTSVVVAARHGTACLERCLEALRRHTALPHEVLVAHEERPPDAALAAAANPGGVAADGAGGLARAWNRCLAGARGDHLVLLDDRARVGSGWLEGLLAALADRADGGLAGPLLPVPEGAQALGEALSGEPPERAAEALRRLRRMDYADVPRLRRECVALRAEVLERVGQLDEGLPEEAVLDDFCLRVRESGLGLSVAGDTYVHLEPPPPAEDAPAAEAAFAAKWGVTVAEYFELGHPPVRRVPDVPEAGDPAVRRLLEQATQALAEGDPAAAQEALALAEAGGGAPAEVPLLRGLVRCTAGDFAAAATEFEEAARRAPRSRRALAHLAHVLRRVGRTEEAARVFTRLLELDPQDAEVLVDTGDCLVAMGRLDTARECFRLARKLAPRNAAVCERLTLLGDAEAAEEELPLAG